MRSCVPDGSAGKFFLLILCLDLFIVVSLGKSPLTSTATFATSAFSNAVSNVAGCFAAAYLNLVLLIYTLKYTKHE